MSPAAPRTVNSIRSSGLIRYALLQRPVAPRAIEWAPDWRTGNDLRESAVSRHKVIWTVVIFGALALMVALCGCDAGGPLPLATTWSPLDPDATMPQPRFGHSVVYDAEGGQMLLFGGAQAGTYYEDLWAYDPAASTWTELDPSEPGPAGRMGAAATYDSSRGDLVVFGGLAEDDYLDDLWTYDPKAGTWTELDPSGPRPSGRVGHSLVYDPGNDSLVLFGGVEKTDSANDVWLYDLEANTWSEQHPAGNLPSKRSGQAMAYDPQHERVLLFGGTYHEEEFDDTWAYDAQADAWTELKPAGPWPQARWTHTMEYDSRGERFLMFGGDGGWLEPLNDIWAYDPEADEWTELDASGPLPPARVSQAMAFDSETGQLLVCGGMGIASMALRDTWIFEPATSDADGADAADPVVAVAPLPDGWTTFESDDVSVAMPDSFKGGDPSDPKVLDDLRTLNPGDYEGAESLLDEFELVVWAKHRYGYRTEVMVWRETGWQGTTAGECAEEFLRLYPDEDITLLGVTEDRACLFEVYPAEDGHEEVAVLIVLVREGQYLYSFEYTYSDDTGLDMDLDQMFAISVESIVIE